MKLLLQIKSKAFDVSDVPSVRNAETNTEGAMTSMGGGSDDRLHAGRGVRRGGGGSGNIESARGGGGSGLMDSLRHVLKHGQKNKLLKEIARYLARKKEAIHPMPEQNVYKQVEGLLEEKFRFDVETEANKGVPKPIDAFAHDFMIMNYGLKTIALKNLISVRLGLHQNHERNGRVDSYSLLLLRTIGLVEKPYDEQEVGLIVKARHLFTEAQNVWYF